MKLDRPKELRRYPRVRLFTNALIETESGQRRSQGQTENISAGGLRLLCPETFDPHTRVTLRFRLPGNHVVEARGVVIHAQKGLQIGVRFTGLRREDRAAIQSFIRRVAGPA